MCFSAGASFVSSGALGGAGLVTVLKTKKFRAIALIPLLFAIQQFIEGLQWLSPHPSQLSTLLGYGFLIFAFLLWPIYIPCAVLSVEKNTTRRNILQLLLIAGVLITVYLFSAMATQPLTVTVLPQGLDYQIYVPFQEAFVFLYVACVSGSLFASSHAFIRVFGLLAMLSAIFTLIVFLKTFTSVWCFFAAALSLLLLFYLNKKELN